MSAPINPAILPLPPTPGAASGVSTSGPLSRSGLGPWRVVAGAAAGLVVGNGPVMQFTFGVFLKPIAQSLHLSRGTVSAALSIGLLGTALAAPFAGRVMDRLGAARVILASVLAFAMMLVLQGWLARGAVSLFVLSALMGIAAAGQTPIGYARTIVTWFEAKRGLALGLSMTGVGVGTIVLPIVARQLITALGWRQAYGGLALLLVVVAVPAVLLCITEGPVRRIATPAEARRAAAAAWRTPMFAKLAGAFTLVAFAANGTIAHVVPMLTDGGMSPARAVGALASIGIALICGRLFAGWVLDRADPILVTAAFFASVLAGIALLGMGPPGAVGVALFLIGLGLGAEIDLLAFLVCRAFGTQVFGELYGALFALFMIGSSIGPLVVGLSYDWTGSYHVALAGLGLSLIAAILLTLSLRRR